MKKWQYKTFESENHKTFIDGVVQDGEDGWELIHVEYINGHVIGFFKRPTAETSDEAKIGKKQQNDKAS